MPSLFDRIYSAVEDFFLDREHIVYAVALDVALLASLVVNIIVVTIHLFFV